MRLRRELDDFYEQGRRTALAGIPPNSGCGPGSDWRYYEMAYKAGYQDALKEAKQWKSAGVAISAAGETV